MLTKPKNSNYCANVVIIKNLIPLENCDNIVHSSINGNLIIVSKNVKIGDVGLYFPVECKLSEEFLKNNNLYSKSILNINKEEKGFFSDSGRVKCQKMRGFQSNGFFIPLSSLDFTKHKEELKEFDEFDEINGIKICEKYVVKPKGVAGIPGNKQNKLNKKLKKMNMLFFNFHKDTPNLWKSIHKIKSDSIIHISQKLHGTSGHVHYIPIYRELSIIEKIFTRIREWAEK